MSTLEELFMRIRVALVNCPHGDLTKLSNQIENDLLPVVNELFMQEEVPNGSMSTLVTHLTAAIEEINNAAGHFRSTDTEGRAYIEDRGGDPNEEASASSPFYRRPLNVDDLKLIRQAQAQGEKISLERVIYIGRNPSGKIVWLEEGSDSSGKGHIFIKERIESFEKKGFDRGEILKAVFLAATTGKVVGIFWFRSTGL